MRSFVEDARGLGVELLLDCAYAGRDGRVIRTGRGDFECGFLVNAAGLHADTVARDHGFSERYRILPFKGLYLYSSEPAGAFRTNLYPVPNLKNPFLGVHVTVTTDGRAKIGPTAIPCLWREQYGWTGNFRAAEFAQIVGSSLGLAFRAGFDFRGLALEEMKKYHRPTMVSQAARLASGIRVEQYSRWGRPGIRAQLVDLKQRTLVQDFCLEGDERSLHVLNAVSPGWTCAIPFSRYVCDRAEESLNRAEPAPARPPVLESAC
jgi:L-2-hydroxyglutarate oxidase LhgO